MKVISFLLILTACTTPSQSKDPVQATFHSKDFVFRQCYHESDSYKGMHVDEKRKVDVNLQIEKDGSVSDAKIAQSDFKDPNFHACVLGTVKKLKFENIEETMTTTQTINFGHTHL